MYTKHKQSKQYYEYWIEIFIKIYFFQVPDQKPSEIQAFPVFQARFSIFRLFQVFQIFQVQWQPWFLSMEKLKHLFCGLPFTCYDLKAVKHEKLLLVLLSECCFNSGLKNMIYLWYIVQNTRNYCKPTFSTN